MSRPPYNPGWNEHGGMAPLDYRPKQIGTKIEIVNGQRVEIRVFEPSREPEWDPWQMKHPKRRGQE